MGIHFPGLRNVDKPVAWVFPELVVCLDCGRAEFVVPEAELRLLVEGDAASQDDLELIRKVGMFGLPSFCGSFNETDHNL